MQAKPGDPPFTLNSHPLLRPIDYQALLLLRREEVPTPSEVCALFNLIPTSHLRRSSKTGSRYFGIGASPRNFGALFAFSHDMPFFTLVITKMLAHVAPDFRFTSCIILRGCKSQPHRDQNNGGDQSLIMQISTPIPGADCGYDPCGDVPLIHLGATVHGRVINIDKPYLFNARKQLHAGFLPPCTSSESRVVLVAFGSINIGSLSVGVREELRALGFRVNTKSNLCETPDSPPRLKQLTLEDLLHLPPSRKDLYDVIQIWDSQDS